jgi:hypothetical protein
MTNFLWHLENLMELNLSCVAAFCFCFSSLFVQMDDCWFHNLDDFGTLSLLLFSLFVQQDNTSR